MKIIGIDASLTATGIVVLTSGAPEPLPYWSTVITSKQNGATRLIEIRQQVKAYLHGADLIVIEDYAWACKNQAHQMGELGGILRVMFQESGIAWQAVNPSHVKKFTTGKGNADKDLMLLNVFKRWGAEFSTSHEADAYTLARIGAALMDHAHGLTAFQLDVVNEIRSKDKKGKEATQE